MPGVSSGKRSDPSSNLSKSQIVDILASYPHENTNQLALRIGTSSVTVRTWLRENGVTIQGNRLSPEIERAVLAAYVEEGLSTGEIKDQYSLSKQTVRDVLARNQIPLVKRRRTNRPSTRAKRSPLSASEQSSIVLGYRQGQSSGELAKEFNTVDTTILRVLDKQQVTRRPQGKLTPDLRLQIANQYMAGAPSSLIASKLEITDTSVLSALKEAGIERRSRAEAKRIYPMDERAFAQLTNDSAYWLGFLMADGCVYDGRLSLTLQKGDQGHLVKLRTFLKGPSLPIRSFGDNAVSLQVNSRQLCADLALWGVLPRKSLTAQASGFVEAHPAFWLGMIDGDGTVGIRKRDGSPKVILCAGGSHILTQFVDYIERWSADSFRPTIGVRRQPTRLYRVTLGGVRARDFLRHLHESRPVALDRKRLKAEQALAYRTQAEQRQSP